jgi:hypothetical protein
VVSACSKPDDVLPRIAELLDDALADPGLAERGPDLADVGALLEADLHEGPPREVDVVVEAPRDQRAEPDDHGHDRDRVGDPAPADEVVVRVPEDLDHIDTLTTLPRPK